MSTPADDPAFADLVRTHRVALYRYVRRRVPAADADDVVAEVFAAAWRHRGRLPDPLAPWLYRTAWHALLHQYRSARRRRDLAARVARQPVDPGHPDAGAERVRHGMARLRPSDAEILRLAYWEELGAADIAYVVGGSAVTVRARLSRARRRLAAELGHTPATAEPPPKSLPVLRPAEEASR